MNQLQLWMLKRFHDAIPSIEIAKVKAKYSYPWWASSEDLEVFWEQANEPVKIVTTSKYLQSAKAGMGREVFEEELENPQGLLEELAERIGAQTISTLKSKMFNQKKTLKL